MAFYETLSYTVVNAGTDLPNKNAHASQKNNDDFTTLGKNDSSLAKVVNGSLEMIVIQMKWPYDVTVSLLANPTR